MKKYIDLIPTNCNKENALCVETGYSLGGYNYWNGSTNQRGYYLYITPVEIKERDHGNIVSKMLGKGLKILLKEVTRKSVKAEREAEILAEEKMQYLIDQVCKKYGLVLKTN